MSEVSTPFVGHHVFHASGGCGADESWLLVGGSGHGHGDDEDVLTLESRSQRIGGFIVYVLDGYAGGKGVGAFGAGEDRDVVFAGRNEGG